ncbi:transmembrane protein 79 isoform X1 [Danio aesculapii]|uniref:transmembrane protein 79 isoform X1 n=1 Tax=Danio aesculapii TaxID=1142201 RepID=UPI0024C0DC6D|nr:transmembrane protein 79 isoform X1 [Danio aesculapii]
MKSKMAEVLISDDETALEKKRPADATDLSSAEEENTLQDGTEETQHTAGDSLTDDDDDEDQQDSWSPEEAAQAFTANVTIVQPHTHTQTDVQKEEEMRQYEQKIHTHTHTPERTHTPPLWVQEMLKDEDSYSVQVMRLCVCVAAAAVIFPLLTWAGFKLLPFEAPPLESSALRLIYTLRCAFFATIPIILGVLAEGVSRLRFRSLQPVCVDALQKRELCVHRHYVRESLHLFLLYFLQLSVMATYTHQQMLRLVPLLTVIFVFGRLIYWVCVAFGSSVRALGFSLSFLPLLVLLGANLYFIGSGVGKEAVFDVAPPTTAPPRKQRWWG